MENEQEKKRQEYQEEVARIVATGKKLMAEANEIISSLPDTNMESHAIHTKQVNKKEHKSPHADTKASQAAQTPQTRQGKGARLGFWGNVCAMFMGYKAGDMLFGDDGATTDVKDDFNQDATDDFEQDSIDGYIEEEEEY